MAPLKSMSVANLTDLKGKVEAAIAEKVTARRKELEMELSDLERHDPSGKRAKARSRGKGGSIAPKYRNPKDPSQTWQAAVYSRFGYVTRSNPERSSIAS